MSNSSVLLRGLAPAHSRLLRFGGSEGARVAAPAPCHWRAGLVLAFGMAALAAGACTAARPPAPSRAPSQRPLPVSAPAPVRLSLVASTALTTDTAFPALGAARFGGVSGCAWDEQDGSVWVVSDDRAAPRIFRVDVEAVKGTLSVVPRQAIDLAQGSGADDWPPVLDLEAIAIDGPRLLVASEGDGARRPRVPPAILAFGRDGRLLTRVPLPPHVLPEPMGDQRRGVRSNRALESLTLAGNDTLIAATEGPLVQDADGPDFERGARVRWLTFTRAGNGWTYDRDYEYPLDAVRQPQGFGASHVEAGLVDLFGLGPGHVLALERAFVRETGGSRRGTNHVTIFDVTVPGAASPETGLAKRLVIDLADVAPRLVPRLRNLDNFEAMCQGPSLADGSRTVLLVSDNNFNARQTTGFVLLRIEEPRDPEVAPPDGTPPPLRVHVDTDVGPDDLAALAFLLARGDVEVTGVSLVEGISRPADGRWRVARLLEAAGRTGVPIGIPGPGHPVPPRRFPAEWRLDDRLMAGASRDDGHAVARGARDLLVEAFSRGDRVLALGPLTNVAAALTGRAATRGRPAVTAMGGAFVVAGNVARDNGPGTAEWNFHADPGAAATVMSRAAVTLVPLDATGQVPVTRDFVEGLAARATAPLGQLAVEWLSTLCPVAACHDVFAWDLVAAVTLVDPRVRLGEEAAGIDIVREGADAGRSLARRTLAGPHRIVTAVDRDAFTRVYAAAIGAP